MRFVVFEVISVAANKLNRRRILHRAAAVFTCLLVAVQFVPVSAKPGRDKPAGKPLQDVIDSRVGAILDRSCQDCHSDHTRWPWYGRVAPISWLLSKDVIEGRAKLNFSDWQRHPGTANARMEICDAVSDGSMPLPAYALIHRQARLSSHDVDAICTWASAPGSSLQREQTSHIPALPDRESEPRAAGYQKAKGH